MQESGEKFPISNEESSVQECSASLRSGGHEGSERVWREEVHCASAASSRAEDGSNPNDSFERFAA